MIAKRVEHNNRKIMRTMQPDARSTPGNHIFTFVCSFCLFTVVWHTIQYTMQYTSNYLSDINQVNPVAVHTSMGMYMATPPVVSFDKNSS